MVMGVVAVAVVVALALLRRGEEVVAVALALLLREEAVVGVPAVTEAGAVTWAAVLGVGATSFSSWTTVPCLGRC